MSIAAVPVPVPASGEGAAVDVSTLVEQKTVVLTGRFTGIYDLLASHDDSHFVPVLQFDAEGVEAVRQTVSGAFKSVRLRAATPGTTPLGPVTCEVSGVEGIGQNSFATLANLATGSSGSTLVIDLAPLFLPTGPEEDICFICRGDFEGQLVVEGSLDGTKFCPIGSFRVDRRPEGSPTDFEFAVLSTQDKTRYVKITVNGVVGDGGVVVTMGGRVPAAGGGGNPGLLQYTDGAGDPFVDLSVPLTSGSTIGTGSPYCVSLLGSVGNGSPGVMAFDSFVGSGCTRIVATCGSFIGDGSGDIMTLYAGVGSGCHEVFAMQSFVNSGSGNIIAFSNSFVDSGCSYVIAMFGSNVGANCSGIFASEGTVGSGCRHVLAMFGGGVSTGITESLVFGGSINSGCSYVFVHNGVVVGTNVSHSLLFNGAIVGNNSDNLVVINGTAASTIVNGVAVNSLVVANNALTNIFAVNSTVAAGNATGDIFAVNSNPLYNTNRVVSFSSSIGNASYVSDTVFAFDSDVGFNAGDNTQTVVAFDSIVDNEFETISETTCFNSTIRYGGSRNFLAHSDVFKSSTVTAFESTVGGPFGPSANTYDVFAWESHVGENLGGCNHVTAFGSSIHDNCTLVTALTNTSMQAGTTHSLGFYSSLGVACDLVTALCSSAVDDQAYSTFAFNSDVLGSAAVYNTAFNTNIGSILSPPSSVCVGFNSSIGDGNMGVVAFISTVWNADNVVFAYLSGVETLCIDVVSFISSIGNFCEGVVAFMGAVADSSHDSFVVGGSLTPTPYFATVSFYSYYGTVAGSSNFAAFSNLGNSNTGALAFYGNVGDVTSTCMAFGGRIGNSCSSVIAIGWGSSIGEAADSCIALGSYAQVNSGSSTKSTNCVAVLGSIGTSVDYALTVFGSVDNGASGGIALGVSSHVTGVYGLAFGASSVAGANEVVVGAGTATCAIHSFSVKGYHGSALDTLKAVDNPGAAQIGLYVTWNNGATITSKQVLGSASPPLNSIYLYLAPP